MLRDLLYAENAPDDRWWLDRFLEIARQAETNSDYQVNGGAFHGFSGRLSAFVENTVAPALEASLEVREACDRWYSGAYLFETVPSVLFILARHGQDPEEAIVRAVNDTRDNATVAAIVGAAVGALHGTSALPRRWTEALTGRTQESDDGTVQRLAAEAAAKAIGETEGKGK